MVNKELCKIYLLTNTINNKVYVGQTWLSLQKRMGPNGSNYKNSIYLYNALQKYGYNNFVYKVLAEVNSQEEADRLEGFYIKEYNSQDLSVGYNLKNGGSAGKHSEETKQKIGIASASRERTKEEIDFIYNLGKQWNGVIRGPHSEERKEEISKASTEWHQNNQHPMLGNNHTEESKEKISISLKGRKMNPESAKKSAESRKMSLERENAILQAYASGMIISDIEKDFETGRSSIYRILKRNNIKRERENNSWQGKVHTEKTKVKMAEARSLYWKNKDK